MQTTVVNLFAGPGTGKSTNTALIFGELKKKGVSVEMVHEFAKDLVWEKRETALGFSPYILGKQMYHIKRLLGQVRLIITDSPILLASHIYGEGDRQGYADRPFKQFVEQTFKSWDTINIFLMRDLETHPFVDAGRTQNKEEAIAIDQQILDVLNTLEIPFYYRHIDEPQEIADDILCRITEPTVKPFKIESDCHGFGEPSINWNNVAEALMRTY